MTATERRLLISRRHAHRRWKMRDRPMGLLGETIKLAMYMYHRTSPGYENEILPRIAQMRSDIAQGRSVAGMW